MRGCSANLAEMFQPVLYLSSTCNNLSDRNCILHYSSRARSVPYFQCIFMSLSLVVLYGIFLHHACCKYEARVEITVLLFFIRRVFCKVS